MSKVRLPDFYYCVIKNMVGCHYRMLNLSQELAGLADLSGAPQIFHIFIASSDGQTVKTIVPSGPRQL